MKTMTRTIALVAALGAIAPATANAGSLFNTHAQLVQKINNAYGTQFKTHGQTDQSRAARNTGNQKGQNS